jgi:hypothetical protein
MNHYSAAFWPRADHNPVSHGRQVTSIHGFVPQLARKFGEHLSVFCVDAIEILVFERDSAGCIAVSLIRFKIDLKKLTPTKACQIHDGPLQTSDAVARQINLQPAVYGFVLS